MTLIVETGAGISGAESYASVSAATAYWGLRPHDPLAATWTSQATTDAQREGALREATAYLDATFGAGYVGGRAAADQSLLWPRVTVLTTPGARAPLYRHYGIARPYGCFGTLPQALLATVDACEVDLTLVYGSDGLLLPALPTQLVTATIELAARALTRRLAPDYETGQRVKREAAGDTSFEYFDEGRAAASFGIVTTLLGPILAGAGQPGWSWR